MPSRHAKKPLQIVYSESLNVSSMDDLLAILQQPASQFALANPGKSVQITQPSLCPVCFNLDPLKVPHQRNRARSWAKSEFKIPEETPMVCFQIDKGTDLVGSSQGGCFTCNMLATALSGIVRNWEEKTTFLQVFLASGLPLVLRFVNGSTASLRRIGPAEARSYGAVLPEGKKLAFDIVMKKKDEELGSEMAEIEIYRPSVAQEEPTAGGECVKFIRRNS